MGENNETRKAIEAFTKAKWDMIGALKKAQSLIWEELDARKSDLKAKLGDGKAVEVLSNEGKSGNGEFKGSNDRQLFRWVGVKVTENGESREYLIDLFYNDIGSNNFHSQIGHFQFAALLPVKEGERARSPHERLSGTKTPEGEWETRVFRFNDHRVKDSGQYLPNEGREDLSLFDPAELVEDFFDFVKEQEEKRRAEKEG